MYVVSGYGAEVILEPICRHHSLISHTQPLAEMFYIDIEYTASDVLKKGRIS